MTNGHSDEGVPYHSCNTYQMNQQGMALPWESCTLFVVFRKRRIAM